MTPYALTRVIGLANTISYAEVSNSGINTEKPCHARTDSLVSEALITMMKGIINTSEEMIRKICTPIGVFAPLFAEPETFITHPLMLVP